MPHRLLIRSVCMGLFFLFAVGFALGESFGSRQYNTTDRKVTFNTPDFFVRQKQLPTTNHIWYFKNKNGDVELQVKFYTNVEATEITPKKLLQRSEKMSQLTSPSTDPLIQEAINGIKTCRVYLGKVNARQVAVYYGYYTESKVLYETYAAASGPSKDYEYATTCVETTKYNSSRSSEPPGIPDDPKTVDPTSPKGTVVQPFQPTINPSAKSDSNTTEEVFWTPLKIGLIAGGGGLLVLSLGLLVLLKILKAGKSKDDDDDRPRKKKRPRDDDEEDERPRKKKKVDYDDDEDERPKAKSKKPKPIEDDEEEDDDPPPRKPVPKGPPKPPPPKPKR